MWSRSLILLLVTRNGSRNVHIVKLLSIPWTSNLERTQFLGLMDPGPMTPKDLPLPLCKKKKIVNTLELLWVSVKTLN
jgi:hypothetical protein